MHRYILHVPTSSKNKKKSFLLSEKTLDLLFKGAKKTTTQDVSNDPGVITTKKDKMKQLFIGSNGALLHSGSLVRSLIKYKSIR